MPVNSISSHVVTDQAAVNSSGFVGAMPLQSPTQNDVVLALQNRIRRVETAQRVDHGKIISSGCEAINRLLPGRGYSPGTIVQWFVPDRMRSNRTQPSGLTPSGLTPSGLTPGGFAADYLSLLSAIEACKDGRSLVVLDPWHQFYPPAVASLGVDMANLIILRSRQKLNAKNSSAARSTAAQTDSDLYWAIDQSLRCSAVGAVWGPLGSIDERWFRRFQLSAESSGCLGLFIQSAREAKQPSWAEVQWLAGANPNRSNHQLATQSDAPSKNDRQQRVQLRLLRCRGSKVGASIDIGVDAITGQVKANSGA